MEAHILDELFAEIKAKSGDDPGTSYTASLLASAPEKPVRKLAEEVTETIIEVMKGDKDALAKESADLLYHLLVVWQSAGLSADDVWAVLRQRRGISGLVEKANRSQT